jgi:hypothetical protein
MTEAKRNEELEQATRLRLARLASVPVEIDRLEKSLQAALAAETGSTATALPTQRPLVYRFWKPITALAASVAVAVIVGLIVLGTQASPVVAAPADMAALHQEVSVAHAGKAVTTIDQANRFISSEWSSAPALPAPPTDHLMSCCVHDLKSRKVACVLLNLGDQPVTMVVAKSQDVCCADGRTIERSGRTYTVHEVNGLQMVNLREHGRYVCLMGRVPLESLLDIADKLRF